MSDLSILCVTEGRAHAHKFVTTMALHATRLHARLVLAVDGEPKPWMPANTVKVRSTGCIESVLDEAVNACPDGYVLRLDDDEQMSAEMRAWLANGSYRDADHWAFPRLNLWPDVHHYISNQPLYPDLQTRLSVKEKSGGRTQVHVGSPYGTGQVAPCAIEHHKFLVRPLHEREALIARYDRIQPGAGADFVAFSVPERFEDQLVTVAR